METVADKNIKYRQTTNLQDNQLYLLIMFQAKAKMLPTGMPSTKTISPIPAGAMTVVCQYGGVASVAASS